MECINFVKEIETSSTLESTASFSENDDKQTCSYIFKRGLKKGKQCTVIPKDKTSQFCASHCRDSRKSLDEVKMIEIPMRRSYNARSKTIKTIKLNLYSVNWGVRNPDKKKESQKKFTDKNPNYWRERRAKKCGLNCIPERKTNISYLELYWREIITNELRDYEPEFNIKPIWLKNTIRKGGKNLELDIYYRELNLAFEINGEQHYGFVHQFHKSEKDLEYQIAKDELKKELCTKNGVHLITTRYDEKDPQKIINMIRDYLSKR